MSETNSSTLTKIFSGGDHAPASDETQVAPIETAEEPSQIVISGDHLVSQSSEITHSASENRVAEVEPSNEEDDSPEVPINRLESMLEPSENADDANEATPLEEARATLVEIQRKLAFLDDIEATGDGLMQRIGGGGRFFVATAAEIAENAAGILPRSFDLEGFLAQARMLHDLSALADELRSLANRVAAGEATIGSEAFAQALAVHQAAKAANLAGDLDNYLNRLCHQVN